MELDISTERDGGVCAVTVKGEVDVYTSPKLKEQLVTGMQDDCSLMIVSLDGVGFIDSSGLGVLVGGLRRMKESGGDFRLVCTREQVLKILRITGLDKVFPIAATLDEARGN